MNNFDITTLEEALKSILTTGAVSATVWNNRPKTVDSTKNDFVVASVQSNMEDMDAYGDTFVNIALFAKDGSGFKNKTKLSLMYGKLRDCMPAAYEVTNQGVTVAAYEFDTNPTIFPDVADDYGYHCRIIQFRVTQKVI